MAALRKDIAAALNTATGLAGPIAVRLAWHAAGTFDPSAAVRGGSSGGTMALDPEAGHGANAGLHIARNLLQPVAEKYPSVSRGDLWALAAAVAVEAMGGPAIDIAFGRCNVDDVAACPADGRLPSSLGDASHLREVFGRMGFSDADIVALSGAHTVGRCHVDRSGHEGPWTAEPLKFDNTYFTALLEEEWVEHVWDGKKQYEDKRTGKLMMLETDLALIRDDAFRTHVERYAADQDAFFADFARAYGRLLSLGVDGQCPFQNK